MNQQIELSFYQMVYNLNIIQRRNILIIRICLTFNSMFLLFVILNLFQFKIKIGIGLYFLIFLLNQIFIYLITKYIYYTYSIEIDDEFSQINSLNDEEIKDLLIEKHKLINPSLDELFYDSKCIICFDYLIEKEECIYLNCGHCFCSQCLIKWYKVDNSCPICKAYLLDPI